MVSPVVRFAGGWLDSSQGGEMTDEYSSRPDSTTLLGSNARKFLLAMLAVALAIVGIGWFTAVQTVAYGAMISSLVFAFLPIVIIAIGVVLSLIEIGEPVVMVGLSSVKPYYRWLARQKHPLFWGIWNGVGLGGLALLLLNGLVILPGESKSVEIMARVELAIDEAYRSDGGFPRPDGNGHLPIDRLNGADVPSVDGVVVDGYGRPYEYVVEGRWKLARYLIRSVGYDGAPGGGDDLCLAGATRLSELAGVGSRILDAIRSKPGGRIDGFKTRLNAIRSLRCDGD